MSCSNCCVWNKIQPTGPTRTIELSVRIYDQGLIMAKRYVLHRAEEADRRTALLGLALADRSADKGSCLSDEDMATLVDDVCSREERARCLQHLAHCEKCYQNWLKLTEIVSTGKKKKSRSGSHTIIRPKYFAWVGTIFAAAASVVLFVQITRKTLPPVVPQVGETRIEQKSPQTLEQQQGPNPAATKSVSPPGTDIDTLADKMDDGVTVGAALAPAASVMKMKEPMKKEYSPVESSAVKTRIKVGKRNTIASPGRSESSKKLHHQLQVRLWLNKVQRGCQSRATSREFWAREYTLGQQITHFQSAEEKKLVLELLPLVGDLRSPSVNTSSVCERILHDLDRSFTE